MKNTVVIPLLVLSLAANGVLWYRVASIEGRFKREDADYPLGERMGYMQRYADKLWYAGDAGNWDLARFYQGEVAETSEAIAGAKVVKDGIDVGTLIATTLPPAIDRVSRAIDARDPELFRTNYRAMLETCNGCHVSAQHPFIHVAVPSGPPVQWNQDFAAPPPR